MLMKRQPIFLSLELELIENAEIGSVVGTLVTTDPDESSTEFEYQLIAGATPNNNDLFEVAGDELKAKARFNFETRSSYVI